MSKAVNTKWKKTFPDTIGNQNRPATGVDDTQPFETGAFPQYMANDPVRYDLQNAAMSQSMSNDARLKEMVDARGKELDDHKVDPGAHKTGIAGNAATATKVVTTAASGASANIAEATMASNDFARIRVSGNDNAGELALETADNGDEPIVARQYTGVYTNAVRTAKILDESGNTSFPGTVVAPKFTGSLNGNSATATKLQTPRTLSLTGKAAGSATFDGSANASINVTSVNADSASKLSTARKINITGNALGAATFDGSGDISINTTVNESKHAVNADSATKIVNNGNRNDIEDGAKPPSGLSVYQCYNGTGYPQQYGNVLSIGGLGDNELFLGWQDDARLLFRAKRDTHNNWMNWRAIAFTDEINNYAPTKTGGGASGTWGISISGNANTASSVAWSGVTGKPETYPPSAHNHDSAYPSVTGARASGTWGISISGNADSATNADTVDGYHASDLLSKIYPVGSIYMSMSATNPADLFGVGTWERISQGRMLLGADDSTYKVGATGGEETHTLTAAEMPTHSHSGTTSLNGDHFHGSWGDDSGNTYGTYDGKRNHKGASGADWNNETARTSTDGNHNHTFTTNNTGGSAAHNNMSPYLVCYIWQRTA